MLKLSLNLLVVLFPFSRKMQELSGEATSRGEGWVEGWTDDRDTLCIDYDNCVVDGDDDDDDD